jgi:hypothetical protein
LNEYERAFVEHMSRSEVDGDDFARLTRDAFEAELGGQGATLLTAVSQEALRSPERFASELYKTFGTEALKYFVMIVKYVDSGRFHPQEEVEDEAVDQDLQSIVDEMEPNTRHEVEEGP